MNNLLVAKNITYKYFENSKKNILENVSLSLPEGKITLLCGTSGCGKSTLAYILAGLYPENGGYLLSGEVYVDGVNIHQLNSDSKVSYISIMFQNCDLQFCMNHLENELLFCLENIGTSDDEKEKIIKNVVKKVGIEYLLHRDFNKMSGGEKQKCALCCILALKSKCIILDEAFANVDIQSSKEMIALIKDSGITTLAIDHNIELWEGAYDQVIHMDACAAAHDFQVQRLPEPEEKNIINLQNLYINNIQYPDMKFNKGSITAILGKSGSGKSTLFKTLIKQHKYNGQIKFLGKELEKLNKYYIFSKCGIVFQNPSNQFLSMTVYDEVFFSVRQWNKGKKSEWQAQKTEQLLDVFDLARYKKYAPYLLSQGQQRRLAVLCMIAGEQEILLLDEPTYGQDYENICAIMNLLLEKVHNGLTIIFNTHNEKLAETYANQIIRIGEKNVFI